MTTIQLHKMTSYENDTIIDINDHQYEVETDQNHNNVKISTFRLENTQDSSSTNYWK